MDLDFNCLLNQVNSFGTYQILLCALLVVPSALFCALIYFAQFFIILIPDHWCSVESPEALTIDKSLYIPYDTTHTDRQIYNQCYMYNNSNINQLSFASPNRSTHKCSNGWDYDFSTLYATMATESNWVCDNNRMPYNIQTIYYSGTSIGCLIFGYIADRFGRKPSIIGATIVACVAGIMTSFTYNFWSFAIMRFFVGMSIIPLSEDPYVLSMEYIGTERRTLAIIAWTIGYIIASATCPWLAYSLKSWRLLCFVTSAPLVLFLISAKWIPESASWLLARGKTQNAIDILTKVAAINGRKMPSFDTINNLIVPKQPKQPKKESIKRRDSVIVRNARKIGALHIFLTPRLRMRSLILALCWFITFTCYHTNTHNSSNLGVDVYLSFTYGALMEIPASLICLFTLDIIGRRWPMIIAMTVTGVTGLLTLFIEKGDSAAGLFLTAALIMRVALATNYNIIIQYSTEVFPTILRGRALAYVRFMGTLGLYMTPSIVYLALEDQSWPFAITGLMALIVAVCSLFLPETINENLPQTLDEGENFGKDQRILDFPCIK